MRLTSRGVSFHDWSIAFGDDELHILYRLCRGTDEPVRNQFHYEHWKPGWKIAKRREASGFEFLTSQLTMDRNGRVVAVARKREGIGDQPSRAFFIRNSDGEWKEWLPLPFRFRRPVSFTLDDDNALICVQVIDEDQVILLWHYDGTAWEQSSPRFD